MLTRQKKEEQILKMTQQLSKAEGHFVIQFKGFSVEKMTDLRSQLRLKKAQMKVIRNTLARRALEKYPNLKEVFGSCLKETNAFIFSSGDVSGAAKVLHEFSEEDEEFSLKIKKGVIGKDVLTEEEVRQLASLPPLDELRAKLLALLSTPATSFVRLLIEVPSSLIRVLNTQSLKKKN